MEYKPHISAVSLPRQFRFRQICILLTYEKPILIHAMAHTAHHIHEQFEPRPDAQKLTGDTNGDVDYEPHPEKSIKISTEHQQIMQKIINLYSGSASEDDMQGERAISLGGHRKAPKNAYANIQVSHSL